MFVNRAPGLKYTCVYANCGEIQKITLTYEILRSTWQEIVFLDTASVVHAQTLDICYKTELLGVVFP